MQQPPPQEPNAPTGRIVPPSSVAITSAAAVPGLLGTSNTQQGQVQQGQPHQPHQQQQLQDEPRQLVASDLQQIVTGQTPTGTVPATGLVVTTEGAAATPATTTGGGEAGAAAAGSSSTVLPSLAQKLGVEDEILERLFRADLATEYEQPVWMVVNLQGKIKGSYTADKMLEFCRRGTLSAAQRVLGADKNLPYSYRQELAYYQTLGDLVKAIQEGASYRPLTVAAVDDLLSNRLTAADWSPLVTRTPGQYSAGAGSLAGELSRLAIEPGQQSQAETSAAAAAAAASSAAARRAEALRTALSDLCGVTSPRGSPQGSDKSSSSQSARGPKQPMWLYINHLGWCRGPFPGNKVVHAHLCGRLPRDTLVAGYDPEVPAPMISGNIAKWFRPLGALLDNVANGWTYNVIKGADVMLQGQGQGPSSSATGAEQPASWEPLVWQKPGNPPPLVCTGELGPPNIGTTISAAAIGATSSSRQGPRPARLEPQAGGGAGGQGKGFFPRGPAWDAQQRPHQRFQQQPQLVPTERHWQVPLEQTQQQQQQQFHQHRLVLPQQHSQPSSQQHHQQLLLQQQHYQQQQQKLLQQQQQGLQPAQWRQQQQQQPQVVLPSSAVIMNLEGSAAVVGGLIAPGQVGGDAASFLAARTGSADPGSGAVSHSSSNILMHSPGQVVVAPQGADVLPTYQASLAVGQVVPGVQWQQQQQTSQFLVWQQQQQQQQQMVAGAPPSPAAGATTVAQFPGTAGDSRIAGALEAQAVAQQGAGLYAVVQPGLQQEVLQGAVPQGGQPALQQQGVAQQVFPAAGTGGVPADTAALALQYHIAGQAAAAGGWQQQRLQLQQQYDTTGSWAVAPVQQYQVVTSAGAGVPGQYVAYNIPAQGIMQQQQQQVQYIVEDPGMPMLQPQQGLPEHHPQQQEYVIIGQMQQPQQQPVLAVPAAEQQQMFEQQQQQRRQQLPGLQHGPTPGMYYSWQPQQ